MELNELHGFLPANESEKELVSCFYKVREIASTYEQINANYRLIHRDTTFVYLFYSPWSNVYKIGVSRNINKRLKTLTTPITGPLEVKYICPTHRKLAFKAELQLHKLYANNNVGGEWFSFGSNDIPNVIDSILYTIEEMELGNPDYWSLFPIKISNSPFLKITPVSCITEYITYMCKYCDAIENAFDKIKIDDGVAVKSFRNHYGL